MTQQFLRSLPLLSALAGSAWANSTSTVELILPMYDAQTILGSIVSVEATATTYFLTCPTSEDSTNCGLGSGLELVEGPSTFEIHMTEAGLATLDVACAIADNTASCTSAVTEIDYTIGNTATASSMISSNGVGSIDNISSYLAPVTITAGLEKLTATASGSVSESTGSSASAGATSSGTAAKSTGTSTSTAASSAGTSTASSTSSVATAGVPKLTQNAILAGAAVFVGGAMIL